jgi:hypothetical protein
MRNCDRHCGAKIGLWWLIGLVAIGLAGCNEDQLSISGTPATSVNAGTDYLFQPAATDPQQTALTFTIQNKPAWADFSTSTGELTGKPTDAQIGSFPNIVIAVTNGKATAALPAFSITVTQVSNGSATLSWLPPTQNADGSPLTDLAGYHIYYGTDPATLSQTVKIDNPGLSSYVVENLAPATWHFAMKAFNSKAEESALIGVVSITIR